MERGIFVKESNTAVALSQLIVRNEQIYITYMTDINICDMLSILFSKV